MSRRYSAQPIAIGTRFERLVVVGPPAPGPYPGRFYPVRCDCGIEKQTCGALLRKGDVRSCGCLSRELTVRRSSRHGQVATLLYRCWAGMKSRCQTPSGTGYQNYGKRGIQVCPEWQNFEPFRDWAISHPSYAPGLTIERIDVSGNYEPSNCTWVPQADQFRNLRKNRWIQAFGELKILADWVRDPRCQVSDNGLLRRLKVGWEPEQAIITPGRRRKVRKQ